MRARFDTEYIHAELAWIGTRLDTPLTAYLIGGGAMAFRDLKATTKDIDLVVTDGEGLRVLQAVLHDCGYDIVREPGAEYDDLGAQRIFENDDGCRIDVFNRQVMDKLVLSDGIRERSDPHLDSGHLSVALVSPEDIFLFKAVAGRTDDIEDMQALVQTGLDFERIESELDRQIDLLGQELFVSYVNEALLELDAQYSITTPIADRVAEITERVYRDLELIHAFEGTTTRTELTAALDHEPEAIEETLSRLELKGVITIDGDQITKQSTDV